MCFQRSNPDEENQLKPGLKLEVLHKNDPLSYWVASVVDSYGLRLRLRLEGSEDEANDVWVYFLSDTVHQLGWGKKKKLRLNIPPGKYCACACLKMPTLLLFFNQCWRVWGQDATVFLIWTAACASVKYDSHFLHVSTIYCRLCVKHTSTRLSIDFKMYVNYMRSISLNLSNACTKVHVVRLQECLVKVWQISLLFESRILITPFYCFLNWGLVNKHVLGILGICFMNISI